MRISEVEFGLVKLTYDEFLSLKYDGEYDVVINDSGDMLEVIYVPKLVNSKPTLGGRNINGREIRYMICRNHSEIVERSFAILLKIPKN